MIERLRADASKLRHPYVFPYPFYGWALQLRAAKLDAGL